jgi:hypothetical protein
MLAEIVLVTLLARQPVRFSSEEREKLVYFYSFVSEIISQERRVPTTSVLTSEGPLASAVQEFPSESPLETRSTEEWFRHFAEQWSSTRAIANPNYQAIIKLGWGVVPLMLHDLQDGRGYWYPALAAITGIRPFDRKDAGNTRRMTGAWLNWGRKKNLI